jgi:hypothetical protein
MTRTKKVLFDQESLPSVYRVSFQTSLRVYAISMYADSDEQAMDYSKAMIQHFSQTEAAVILALSGVSPASCSVSIFNDAQARLIAEMSAYHKVANSLELLEVVETIYKDKDDTYFGRRMSHNSPSVTLSIISKKNGLEQAEYYLKKDILQPFLHAMQETQNQIR